MIDVELLHGLVFRTSQGKQERAEDGRLKTRYIPVERPLTPDDILAEKDLGDQTVIVTKDGRKYTIPKGPESPLPSEGEGEGEGEPKTKAKGKEKAK
jgi:hypothetical protein